MGLNRLILGFTVGTLLAACGTHRYGDLPTFNPPPFQTEDAQTEKMRLGYEIAAAGRPTLSWSEDNLVNYEAKIDRFKEIEKMHPEDGPVDVDSNLSTLRAFAESVRTEHTLALLGLHNEPNTISPRPDVATSPSLIAENDRLIDEIIGAGIPNVTWSEARLNATNKKAERVMSNAGKLALMPPAAERQDAVLKARIMTDIEAAINMALEQKRGENFNPKARNAL